MVRILKKLLPKPLKKLIFKSIEMTFSCLKVKPNRILLMSYCGKRMDCNPKAVYEYMKEKYEGHYQFIWALNDDVAVTEAGMTRVRPWSLTFYYYFYTSAFVIVNDYFWKEFKPRRSAKYFILWHGLLSFKCLGLLRPNADPLEIEGCRTDAKNFDYIVCSSEIEADRIRQFYGFEENKIVSIGLPRTDIFFQPDKIVESRNKVLSFGGIKEGKKLILYAPTYRRHYGAADYRLDIEAFAQKVSDDYVLGVRIHHFTYEKYPIPDKWSHRVVDFSFYPDVQELLMAADILITDYSSIFLDYSYLMRPVVFYAYDYDQFVKEEGQFLFDYHSFVPGPVVENMEELIDVLQNIDVCYTQYVNKQQKILAMLDSYRDGKATERFVQFMLQKASQEG